MARRAACVTAVTARLLKEGKHVFSPIAYSHQFAVEHGMGTDWETWKEFGLAMLAKCDRMMVLNIPGAWNSKGMNAEYEYSQSHGFGSIETVLPTPEELAILDEPNPHRCRWHGLANSCHSIGQTHNEFFGKCIHPNYNDNSRCGLYEKVTKPEPIKQPEPKKGKALGCKWHDNQAERHKKCTHKYWVEEEVQSCPFPQDGSENEEGVLCSRYESNLITQPEPKCKFWSDECGGTLRGNCRYSPSTRKRDEDYPTACRVNHAVWGKAVKSPTDCFDFQPADEPKTATISLGPDGMKLVASSNPGIFTACLAVSNGGHGEEVADDEKPTAEEKIIKGLNGFADELEAGRVVVHPCKWWAAHDGDGDGREARCVAPNQRPEIDKFELGVCPLYDEEWTVTNKWIVDVCAYFQPREIPPPEYDHDDVAVAGMPKAMEILSAWNSLCEEYRITMLKLADLNPRKDS